MGLEIDSRIPVHHGDFLHIGRAQIGQLTSAMMSPLQDRQIALACVDVTHVAEGTELAVGKLDGLQKRLPARITPLPPFRPAKAASAVLMVARPPKSLELEHTR